MVQNLANFRTVTTSRKNHATATSDLQEQIKGIIIDPGLKTRAFSKMFTSPASELDSGSGAFAALTSIQVILAVVTGGFAIFPFGGALGVVIKILQKE